MSNEFEVHCFGNLSIKELEECKEDFLWIFILGSRRNLQPV